MQITSREHNSWIRIERQFDSENEYSSFVFEASVEIGHGSFHARNSDVHFLNMEEFIRNLDSFITDRSLKPSLSGTYDTVFKIYGSATRVIVEFTIGDAFCGDKTNFFGLTGSFEMDQEHIMRIVAEFKKFQPKT